MVPFARESWLLLRTKGVAVQESGNYLLTEHTVKHLPNTARVLQVVVCCVGPLLGQFEQAAPR